MPTRPQIRALLDDGRSLGSTARAFGIPPGQALMIATGHTADGGEEAEAAHRLGVDGSPQQLINPRPYNPTDNPRVLAWVRARAAQELQRRS